MRFGGVAVARRAGDARLERVLASGKYRNLEEILPFDDAKMHAPIQPSRRSFHCLGRLQVCFTGNHDPNGMSIGTQQSVEPGVIIQWEGRALVFVETPSKTKGEHTRIQHATSLADTFRTKSSFAQMRSEMNAGNLSQPPTTFTAHCPYFVVAHIADALIEIFRHVAPSFRAASISPDRPPPSPKLEYTRRW